jgi:hypothetical protein
MIWRATDAERRVAPGSRGVLTRKPLSETLLPSLSAPNRARIPRVEARLEVGPLLEELVIVGTTLETANEFALEVAKRMGTVRPCVGNASRKRRGYPRILVALTKRKSKQ